MTPYRIISSALYPALLLVALTPALTPSALPAQRVVVDARAGRPVPPDETEATGKRGTLDLLAYSDDGNVPVTTNAATQAFKADGRGGQTAIAGGGTITLPSGRLRGISPFATPAWGLVRLAKPVDQTFVVSKTDGSWGEAAWLPKIPTIRPNRVRAQAVLANAGNAAAEAIDPIRVGPGSYPYDPLLFSMLLELGPSTSQGGASYFAFDSRSPVPLWQLSVWGSNGLRSASDLTVSFDYDATRIVLAPGLTRDSVTRSIRNGFDTFSPGRAEYASEELPLFTGTYLVSGDSVSFGEGVNAMATTSGVTTQLAPEPASLLLTLTGLGGVLLARQHVRPRA